MVTAIADVRSTRRDDCAPVTIAAVAAAVTAAFMMSGYERSGWTTATIAVMSCVYARGGRPIATALRAVVVYGRARVFSVLQPRGGSSSRRCTRARPTLVRVSLFFNFIRRNFARRRRRRVFLTRVTRTRRSQRPAWTSDGWCSGGVLRRSRRTRS